MSGLLQDYLHLGCEDMSHTLGFCKMPKGYYLLLNSDHTHYFWLDAVSGRESCISWDKWAAYRGAVADQRKTLMELHQ